MPKKEKDFIGLPDELGHSFDKADDILHFRPELGWQEPEPINFDPLLQAEQPAEDLQTRTQSTISAFQANKELAEAVQKRIDNRVKALGGMEIQLDKKKDAHVIAAMKRRFPNKTDPTIITYDDYRQCIDSLNSNADNNISPTASDILAARGDILRTDFGGLGNKRGENRPEISSPANSVEAVDLEEYQEQGVLALFNMMIPLIQKLINPF